ncbi:hypothetical protein B7P43_G01479 [Cryptotermes secundus]|uniref:Three prime repair exonuclease 1 n=1 Tax=Cryptotermes secundus TaxID=105785 RepID=A0A2J7RK54_9NEOP|nr:hypothetical protein B7P43_G01479 [Cryptotermes secundus]
MVAALREDILKCGNDVTCDVLVPRVLSKLTICVDPRRSVSKRAAELTHLTNELLQHHSPFDEHLFNMLNEFIERLPQPVCFIAHNGLRFDFPVIQAELYRIDKELPAHIVCADSLSGFRKLLQTTKHVEVETPRSIEASESCLNSSHQVRKRLSFSSENSLQIVPRFTLNDVYRFLLKKDPVNSHCAEKDFLSLLECIVKMGQSFTDWVDKNAVQFNSVKKMG